MKIEKDKIINIFNKYLIKKKVNLNSILLLDKVEYEYKICDWINLDYNRSFHLLYSEDFDLDYWTKKDVTIKYKNKLKNFEGMYITSNNIFTIFDSIFDLFTLWIIDNISIKEIKKCIPIKTNNKTIPHHSSGKV